MCCFLLKLCTVSLTPTPNHKAVSMHRTGIQNFPSYSLLCPTFFTASEEISQLLATHKEKYWLQEEVKCGFYHSLLSWDRLTRSIFQSFLGENTAQIPKLSIYYFSLVTFNSNQHWLLLRQFFVSHDLPEKSRFLLPPFI